MHGHDDVIKMLVTEYGKIVSLTWSTLHVAVPTPRRGVGRLAKVSHD